MRKMFLSFSGTCYAISDGRITDADLANGLFFFTSSREKALTESEAIGRYPALVDGEYREQALMLIKALRTAVVEMRAMWGDPRGGSATTYDVLNELLEDNGIKRLDCTLDRHNFNYPTIKRLAQEQDLPLEVISN